MHRFVLTLNTGIDTWSQFQTILSQDGYKATSIVVQFLWRPHAWRGEEEDALIIVREHETVLFYIGGQSSLPLLLHIWQGNSVARSWNWIWRIASRGCRKESSANIDIELTDVRFIFSDLAETALSQLLLTKIVAGGLGVQACQRKRHAQVGFKEADFGMALILLGEVNSPSLVLFSIPQILIDSNVDLTPIYLPNQVTFIVSYVKLTTRCWHYIFSASKTRKSRIPLE